MNKVKKLVASIILSLSFIPFAFAAFGGYALLGSTGNLDIPGFTTSGTGFGVPGNLFYVDDTGAMVAHDLGLTYLNVSGDIDGSANLNIDNIANVNVLSVGGGVAGSSGSGLIALGNNGTIPSTSVDAAQLYATDISAGHATLAIATEQAVASDAALVSTNSITVFVNGSKYKIPLVLVP
ncbi:MAG: hypothetical protein V4549_03495 [Bacteroidota bacterium]